MQRSISRHLQSKRFFGTAIKHSAFGVPEIVLKSETVDAISKLNDGEVSMKFIAAPINPSDLNMVEGVYGVKPKLPAVGGNEGVAVITAVGKNVNKLVVGDWVIPFRAGFGTWRQEAVAQEKELIKVANDIPAAYASTLAINPSTAYRLLRDFEKLSPGDVVIQNGANSMVGLAVVQMAKLMGLRTVNIIRSDRPNATDVLRMIETLGGDVNITDDVLNTIEFTEILADLPPIKLGFNCIGGKPAAEMMRCLGTGATIVTYGGMSKQPLTFPSDLVISKQLKVKGFWIATSDEKRGIEEKEKMCIEICNMIREKTLTFFYEVHDFDDFHHALDVSTRPYQLRKVILNLDHPDRLKEHDAMDPKEYRIFETSVV